MAIADTRLNKTYTNDKLDSDFEVNNRKYILE
jgi:hypothetical protein